MTSMFGFLFVVPRQTWSRSLASFSVHNMSLNETLFLMCFLYMTLTIIIIHSLNYNNSTYYVYSIHSFYHFLSIPSFEIFHMTWETRNRWGRNSHPNLAGEIRQLWSHLEGMVVIDSKTWGVTWCNCTSNHQINTINVGSDHHDTRNGNTSRRSCFCLFNSWNFSSRKRGMRVTIYQHWWWP